ncbi:protein of unknown function [Geopseudomonas sagittaria]|uniref:Protein-glutamine gamma-glutamyltransferase-like C-terminal domain-containing protein n=1 Tax=Geopseudomonas sagittaria TaxID=1135990 RepID=A0A1I5NLE9_9GAMM|nr:DUF4129 domain-containing protein [Pseudomonas sagittaria]SFP22668.1 protein of unknown function [Pseudomonas sagittaria]
MPLSDAAVAVRLRSPWEAVDLGVRLAQRHAGLLLASWALLTLPLLAVLSLLLWRYPSVALLLFWWLKPAFERLPLHILSRALFGATPTLGQALRAWPGLLRGELLASLTWRRFSLSRSFTLPLLQLENLRGQARRQRLDALGRRSSVARWLTLLGMHIELLLWTGLLVLIYLLLPSSFDSERGWLDLLLRPAEEWLWLEHLSNACYALVLVLWEPIYVACGFSLYLNRRSELEAWDLELAFRRLLERLGQASLVLLLSLGLWLPPGPALAQETAPETAPTSLASLATCPLPGADDPGPQAARLTHQPLDSQQARREIQALLAAPPFRRVEERLDWGWSAGDESTAPPSHAPQWLQGAAALIEVLLWALLVAGLALLAWRYRDWLRLFAARGQAARPAEATPPAQLFGLAVDPRSLPDDLPASVEQLWPTDPRAALALLYRGLLSHLLHQRRLPLRAAHTEGEVLVLLQGLDDPALGAFARRLLDAWQALAYGSRPPPAELGPQLCDAWRQLGLNSRVHAEVAP